MYIQLARNLYKEFIGVIFCSSVEELKDKTEYNVADYYDADFVLLTEQDDICDVVDFYQKNGRNITMESLQDHLSHGGYVCVARVDGAVVGVNCLFNGELKLIGGSRFTIQEDDKCKIFTDELTLYSCYIIITPELRSKGLYQGMLKYIAKNIYEKRNYKSIFTITNTNNISMMSICSKYYRLIGLTSVKTVRGHLFSRIPLFLNERSKCWECSKAMGL